MFYIKRRIILTFDIYQIWNNLLKWFVDTGPKLLIAILIFIALWWFIKLIMFFIKKGLTKVGVEKSVITFLSSFCKYLLRIFAFIIALTPFGFHVSSLFAALGAAGITLGLGLKESVSNIASGIQIIITKPFQVGHYIEMNSVEGTVTRVEIMYSTLMTLDKKEVVIPNSTITNSVLTNFTALGMRRVDFDYTIRYGTDLNLVRTILLKTAHENQHVLKSPEPRVVVLKQSDNGIEISFRVYCAPQYYWNVFFDLQEKVKYIFELNSINLPYTQVDIHFHEDSKIHSNIKKTVHGSEQPTLKEYDNQSKEGL